MATPKKKVSRSRRDKRRFSLNNLPQVPVSIICAQCGNPVRPHSLCSQLDDCYYYQARMQKKALNKPTTSKDQGGAARV